MKLDHKPCEVCGKEHTRDPADSMPYMWGTKVHWLCDQCVSEAYKRWQASRKDDESIPEKQP
jgi:hypothetical protein